MLTNDEKLIKLNKRNNFITKRIQYWVNKVKDTRQLLEVVIKKLAGRDINLLNNNIRLMVNDYQRLERYIRRLEKYIERFQKISNETTAKILKIEQSYYGILNVYAPNLLLSKIGDKGEKPKIVPT